MSLFPNRYYDRPRPKINNGSNVNVMIAIRYHWRLTFWYWSEFYILNCKNVWKTSVSKIPLIKSVDKFMMMQCNSVCLFMVFLSYWMNDSCNEWLMNSVKVGTYHSFMFRNCIVANNPLSNKPLKSEVWQIGWVRLQKIFAFWSNLFDAMGCDDCNFVEHKKFHV